ncbi:MAG TPA: hypothetical protein VGF31_10875, partial [Myxococcaceae bacterium]
VRMVVPRGGLRFVRSRESEPPARLLFLAVLMQPDRVDPPRGEQPRPPRQRFEETLRARTGRSTRRPPIPPRQERKATAGRPLHDGLRADPTPGELRGLARREMDRGARQRVADGRAATSQATGRLEVRSADLLRAALRTEEALRTQPVAPASPTPVDVFAPCTSEASLVGAGVQAAPGPVASASVPGTEGRVERALALVERIERFVRSGRPSLALTLRGAAPARLEVERVAPGAVSLRLSSTRPPPASELRELRQALEARGLSVSSFDVRASGADACFPSP